MTKRDRNTKLKAGVIGYGGAFNMGLSHLKEMQAAGMTPVAVCEIEPSRLEAATRDFPGIELYSSAAEMLRKSDVQIVSIITPHNTHAPLALQCLRAGRHVVSEKPMAVTTAECDRMIAAARASRVVLSTYHNRHWDGSIMRAVREIRRGAIGKVFRVEAHMGSRAQPGDWWRTSRSISGGILYDWGVHLLEYSLQILQANVLEVSGFGISGHWAPRTKWKADTNEDEAFAIARLTGNKWLTLSITSVDALPKESDRGMLEITGTEGTYVMGYNDWRVIRRENNVPSTSSGKNPPSEGWRFYRNIANHILKGEKLVITPEWARRPIHILDLACRSAEQHRTLKARYL